jgi:hypothetical protein
MLVWTPRLREESFASVGDLTPVVQLTVIHGTDTYHGSRLVSTDLRLSG